MTAPKRTKEEEDFAAMIDAIADELEPLAEEYGFPTVLRALGVLCDRAAEGATRAAEPAEARTLRFASRALAEARMKVKDFQKVEAVRQWRREDRNTAEAVAAVRRERSN